MFGKAKRKRNYPSFISCCHYPSYLQYRFYSLLYCCLLAPKCSLIGFYSSKEISIVALFVSLTASIFLLSTSFRFFFFPDISVFPVPQFPRFLMTFQNFTLERSSVFHMHRSFNENLHAGYATSLHDET